MTVYGCHQYLVDNGYEVVEEDLSGCHYTYFTKHFDGYIITITQDENRWGGKEVIDIQSTKFERNGSNRLMRPPSISFFATGYYDYKAMEEKAKEIVEKLNEWAIETI